MKIGRTIMFFLTAILAGLALGSAFVFGDVVGVVWILALAVYCTTALHPDKGKG